MDIENVNDKNSGMDIMTMEAPLHHIHSNPLFHKIKLSQLKKSKSMESLLPPSKADDKESKVNASSTLEFVSSLFIQKLKFNEWSAVRLALSSNEFSFFFHFSLSVISFEIVQRWNNKKNVFLLFKCRFRFSFRRFSFSTQQIDINIRRKQRIIN